MKLERGKFASNFLMLIHTSLLQYVLLTGYSTQMLMNCEFIHLLIMYVYFVYITKHMLLINHGLQVWLCLLGCY